MFDAAGDRRGPHADNMFTLSDSFKCRHLVECQTVRMTGLGKTSVELALLAESAAQFKGAAHRLESELRRLRALADEASRQPEAYVAYMSEWPRVERLRHDLMIQREAMGMVHHEDFLEIYALPPSPRSLPRREAEPPRKPAPLPQKPSMWAEVRRWLRFR